MSNIPDVFDQPVDYKIDLKIEKYHTKKALDAKAPDEIFTIPGNCLTNKGINLIWKALVDPNQFINDGTGGRWERHFNNANSFIGVGNADNTPPTATSPIQATAADTMLYAEEHYGDNSNPPILTDKHYLYMKMNDTYPLAGDNQKVVFQSTFLPGVAVFNWYEWCIANGNGNQSEATLNDDKYIIRTGPWGIADGNDIEDVAPDPIPEAGVSFQPVNSDDREKKTLLNHRFESMGRKYASATWIITVEVSLS